MKRILSVLLCFIAFLSYSQEDYKKANDLFNNKDYKSALKLYLESYKTESDDNYLNGQIGLCYSNIIFQEPEAIQYIEKAFENKKNKKNEDLVYALAIAYMHNLQFDKAIPTFNDFIDLTKDETKIGNAELKIENCINAQAYVNAPKDILFINQGKKINTEDSEINPYITKDEKLLVFSSNYDIDYDIYINLRKKFFNSWTASQEINSEINNTENQILSGIDEYADNVFYFEDTENSEVHLIEFKEFNFQNSIKLDESINSVYNEKGISPIGLDTLIFSSNRPGGFGGYDLYYSIRLPNGNWGMPINVGDKINTIYNENYPSYTSENQTLFFSSDRPASIGGYDIFFTNWNLDSSDWSFAQNMGYPLNTTYDDNTIAYLEMERYAYVSRYNVDSYGEEDIYKAVFKDEEPQYMVYKVYIDVYSADDKDLKPINECNTDIEINIIDLDNIALYGKYTFDKTKSYFIVSLPPGLYSLQVIGEAYLEYEKNIFVEERLMEETLDDLKIELELK